MSKLSSYTKPELRERIKSRVMASGDGGKPGQWSARKAQLVAQKYESAGGGYSGAKTEGQKSLSKWTDQKWTTSDGKPAERKGGTTRYLPEKAWDKLSPGERSATNAKKREGSREGEQFVKNTAAAAEARKESAMKKEAIGFATEIDMLGLPSAAGYVLGRSQPMTDALAKKEVERDYNILGGLVIPGYTGYHFGTRHAAAARLRELENQARAAQMAAQKEASESGAWQRSEGKNPEGGLNAKGRASLKAQGHDIKPGVKGPADTPEKMKRKGSFLSRMFGPGAPGSMKKDNGEPSRRALSAKAWGEPVPSDDAGRARLYAKGQAMLKRYSGKKEAEDHAVKTAAFNAVLQAYGLEKDAFSFSDTWRGLRDKVKTLGSRLSHTPAPAVPSAPKATLPPLHDFFNVQHPAPSVHPTLPVTPAQMAHVPGATRPNLPPTQALHQPAPQSFTPQAPRASQRDYENISGVKNVNMGVGGMLAASPEGAFIHKDPKLRKMFEDAWQGHGIEEADALAHQLMKHQAAGGQMNAMQARLLMRRPEYAQMVQHMKTGARRHDVKTALAPYGLLR